MIAIIGTSDRPCWLAEACKILLLLNLVNRLPTLDFQKFIGHMTGRCIDI